MNKMFSRFSGGKKVLGVLVVLLIMVAVVSYCGLYTYISYSALVTYQLQGYVPVIFALIAMLVGFMLSIYRSKGMLFDSKDNNLLFSLPIPARTILTTRIINLLSINYVSTLAIFMPAMVIYGVLAQASIVYYVLGIVVFICIPAIPTVLASLIGYIIAYLTSKLGSKKYIEIIMTFALFFGVYFGISYIMGNAQAIVTNLESFTNFMTKYLFFFEWIKEALASTNMLSLLYFVLTNGIIFAIFVSVLSFGYQKILLQLGAAPAKTKHGKTTFESSSVTMALLKKEIKKYFGTPVYVFNSGFGVVILLVATIAAIFMGKEGITNLMAQTNMMGAEGVTIGLFPILIAAIGFLVAMTTTTSSSISLEGQNLWILKSLPISTRKILWSKILLNMLVSLPITLICIIVLGILAQISVVEIILTMVFAFVINIVTAYFGLWMNLLFPKLKYESEIQVVKQSLSSFISIFVPLMICMMGISIFFYMSTLIPANITVIAVCAVLAVIALIEVVIVNTWGVKKFDTLE